MLTLDYAHYFRIICIKDIWNSCLWTRRIYYSRHRTRSLPSVQAKNTTIGIVRSENDIPVKFLSYCIARDDGQYLCPADFENIETIWYLNHSGNPNAEQRSDGYYATSYIPAGEEILIDYNSLDEPEDKKEDFYHS